MSWFCLCTQAFPLPSACLCIIKPVHVWMHMCDSAFHACWFLGGHWVQWVGTSGFFPGWCQGQCPRLLWYYCMCEYVFIWLKHFSSFPRSTLSHSAVCLKPVVPSVSSLHVCEPVSMCVCVCVLSFRRSEYIMQMRGKMRRKKQRVVVSRRVVKEGKWNGNEVVCVCVCLCTAVYICVFEHLPESCTVSH